MSDQGETPVEPVVTEPNDNNNNNNNNNNNSNDHGEEELSEEQSALIGHFMEVSGEDNPATAALTLAHYNWDLQTAVAASLAGGDGISGSNAIGNDTINGVNVGVGGSVTNDGFGSSGHGSNATGDDEEGDLLDAIGIGNVPGVGIARGAVGLVGSVVGGAFNLGFNALSLLPLGLNENEEDDDDDDGTRTGNVQGGRGGDGENNGGEVLTEGAKAVRRLERNWRSRYGAETLHPEFYHGSFQEALTAAKNQYKFLIVYLHSPMHQSTPEFVSKVFGDEGVVEYLNATFLVWVADVTTPSASAASAELNPSTFPFVSVLQNVRAPQVVARQEGPVSAGELLELLQNVQENQGPVLIAAQADEQEREQDRMLRAQQEAEYQAAMAADAERERLKAEEEAAAAEAAAIAAAEAAAAEKAEAEARAAEEARIAALEAVREAKIAALPDEPAGDEEGVVKLRFRLLDGTQVERRFRPSESLSTVFDFVFTQGIDTSMVNLVMQFPRRVFEEPSEQTLEELGWRQESVFVQEKTS